MHVGRWAGVLRRCARGDEQMFLAKRATSLDATQTAGAVSFAARARSCERRTRRANCALAAANQQQFIAAAPSSSPSAWPTPAAVGRPRTYAIRTGATRSSSDGPRSASGDVVAYAIDGCDR